LWRAGVPERTRVALGCATPKPAAISENGLPAIPSSQFLQTLCVLDRLKNVQKIRARQSAELSSRICDIGTAPAWFCVGRSLIPLSEQHGQSVGGHFEIEVTQEALAQIAGTSLFNVNHQLSSWEFLGLVLRRRCTIVILDLPALKELCGMRQSM